MLQYFESFDTMARIEVGLDAGGDQDTAPAWGNPTYARHNFVTGRNSHGLACRVYETMSFGFDYSVASEGISSGTADLVGVGAWVKLFANVGGNQDGYIFSIGIGETYEATPGLVSLFYNSSGDLSIRWQNSTIGATHSAAVSTSTWNHVWLEVDQVNNIIKLWLNGNLVETITNTNIGTWSTSSGAIHIGRIPAGLNIIRYDVAVDDLFIYNGETPSEDQTILGVQIGATHDRYENTSLTGFLGTMIIDGDRYESAGLYSGIESETYDPGKNVANKRNYKFYVDPSTGEPWTDVDRITHWGVCCVPDVSFHTARLSNMALQVLYWDDAGIPAVKDAKPGPAAYFSGPWVKSDTTLPYYAHVNKIPRDNDLEYDDTTSLFIDDYGCMLFVTKFPPDDEPEPLGQIGITFAEERRTDYVDWADALGRGGVDFVSYFTSGYSLAGQGDKFFANNYTTINYKNVAGGGGYARGVWDFSNNADGSRWSMRQLIYAPTRVTGGYYTHGSRKLLIRGNGRALQVRIDSESGKPFQINGWAMYITGNSKA